MARRFHGAVLALLVVGVASAQQPEQPLARVPVPVEYHHEGETFLVSPIPENKCCFEVHLKGYEGAVGYVGVWADGTPERPYGWALNSNVSGGKLELLMNSEGLIAGNLGHASAEACLEAVATYLLRDYRESLKRQVFDADEQAEELHGFVESIRNGSAPAPGPDSVEGARP